VDTDTVTGALDLDARHAGTVKWRLQHLADANILSPVVAVTLTGLGAVGEPARRVVGGDSQAEPVGIYFLAHYFFPAFAVVFFVPLVELVERCAEPVEVTVSLSSGVARTTVMWLVRLRIWNAR